MKKLERFETLDGLRGLAACAVMIFHANAMVSPLSAPRGYLAVDLFFILSGFVIAYAYETRLPTMGPWRFMLERIIRLYPLYLAGLVIGLIYAFIQQRGGSANALNNATIFTSAVSGAFLLPSPLTGVVPKLYPLNYPAWTLFFELIANGVFALTYRFWTKLVLAIWVTASGALLVWLTVADGSFDNGAWWSEIGFGLCRVGFGFPLGVLLYRFYSGRRLSSHWTFAAMIGTAVALFLPNSGYLLDLVLVLLVFPVIVHIAARTPPPAMLRRPFSILGDASYSLYAIHVPSLAIANAVVARALNITLDYRIGIPVMVMILLAALLLDKRFDQPARRWMRQRLGLTTTLQTVLTRSASGQPSHTTRGGGPASVSVEP